MTVLFDSLVREVDVDAVLAKFTDISPNNQFKYKNGIRTFERRNLTVREFLALIDIGYVIKSIKTNRPDVNKLSKKQGITETFFTGNDLTTLAVSVYPTPDGELRLQIRVTDGGHRSRTFPEFVSNQFVLSNEAYFVNDHGGETKIAGMTAEEILETYPAAFNRWLEEKLLFTVYHNSTPNMDAIETRNRNAGSNHSRAEHRNTLDENVVAEAIRNTSRLIDEQDTVPHRLFLDSKFIGFAPGRLKYDIVTSRLLKMNISGDAAAECGDDELDEMFKQGSTIDSGKYTVREKRQFENALKSSIKMLDIIASIYDEYPSTKIKAAKRNEGSFTALTRFLMSIDTILRSKQKDFVVRDPKAFARAWVYMLEEIKSDNTLGAWIKDSSDEWTISAAFSKYLGQHNNLSKTLFTISQMTTRFAGRYEEFGIVVLDGLRTFDDQDIHNRYVEVNRQCESCSVPLEANEIQGDHDIPYSWGVDVGGVTTPDNLRVLCGSCNNEKSNKYTFDEYLSFRAERETLLEVAA